MKGFGDTDKPSARSEYDIPLLVTEMYDFLTAIGMHINIHTKFSPFISIRMHFLLVCITRFTSSHD